MTIIRIATFNVLRGHEATGPGSWSERRPLLRRAIEVARADVLGLQEVLPSKLADVADLVAPLTLVPGPFGGSSRWSDLSHMVGSVARIVRGRRFPDARERGARSDAKAEAPSVFLMGDFNALPTSRLLRRLTSPSGAGFVDAARSAAKRAGPPVTFHWGRGATRLGLTLDYVLARTSLCPKRAEVIDIHDGRLYPSDHHPLVLEFSPPAG